MSHLPQRKEKNCLNCETEVLGKYCHVCGQENIEPKESVWHLVTHFFNDVTHFDGKFFSSLKLLILRPGFLSKEYIIGRRASYLNPIRMYLFTSAIFFLVFFSVIKFNINDPGNLVIDDEVTKMDSLHFSSFTREINKGKPMTSAEYQSYLFKKGFHFTPSHYRTKEEYDSILKTGLKKHNWVERQLVYKDIALNEKYKGDPKAILTNLIEKFVHTFPQLLFVLLPLFALILRLLYVRRRFFYVDHLIFAIHVYIFVFIAMLIIFATNKLKASFHWSWLNYLLALLILTIFFYFYKALRNFYQQKRAKTILKYFIFLICLLVTSALLFCVFFMFSLFQL